MTVRKTILHVVAAGVLVVTGMGLAAGTAAAADASSSTTVVAASAASDGVGLIPMGDSGWQGIGS
ncbi:hypothetical protein [Streptomyces sp. NPDC046805]|uniref:hypothetical protein n=1 Tax=Streptomyces sp. NPDC046805 TaxID=3155134 RepID=UPI0033E67970